MTTVLSATKLDRDFDPTPLIIEWAALWSCPDLPAQVTLEFRSRLRVALGRCAPSRPHIRVADWLLEAPRPLLLEVLCHEVAHAAVHRIHGSDRRPHGSEWTELMRLAGFEPRIRIPASEFAGAAPPHPKRPARVRATWEHRCPVCQTLRLARRPVPQWRCASCKEAGLSGELMIERMSAPAEHSGSATPDTQSIAPSTVGS